MKNLIILCFMAFLVSCGTVIKNDVSKWDDSSARYESVFTIVGSEANMGPAVYQIKDSSTTTETIKILTVLTGTYEIRSDSCSFLETGKYTQNEIIEFPISKFYNGTEEKLCTVTIQINPEFESTVAIYPRYSIIYLQFTNRPVTTSGSFQLPSGFNAGRLVSIYNVEKYRLIQNCIDAQPRVIKESTVPANIAVNFDELDQNGISSCYYSLVYTSEGKQGRHAFAVNVYNKEHSPLKANVIVDSGTVAVSSESTASLCSVGTKHANKSSCKQKLSKLSNPYVIQVHTNKRSYYEIRTK